jgi:hypothetical protein
MVSRAARAFAAQGGRRRYRYQVHTADLTRSSPEHCRGAATDMGNTRMYKLGHRAGASQAQGNG